ncbi:hypothetical protein [Arenibacter sp. P308M17]|uniref:hypothetical protein n=1 Tax=Arenibacter sp. P308M17 TaxID=2303391 RepID=UPI0015F2A7C0|nr:hypothetical protein [Arenibacter sp. P308M17]
MRTISLSLGGARGGFYGRILTNIETEGLLFNAKVGRFCSAGSFRIKIEPLVLPEIGKERPFCLHQGFA